MRANCSKRIVRSSEMHSTLISRKYKMHITPKVKDYIIPVVCKNGLINFRSISNPTLIVSKYSNVIPSKFKVVKFTLE